jgi:hypothetical protein
LQDWFATDHAVLDLIDDARKRWTVNTATEFHGKLCKAHPSLADKFPPRTTIGGWFKFPGKKSAAQYPRPNPVWRDGYINRCNMRLRMSTGRKPKLVGCSDALDQAISLLKAMRTKGSMFATPGARGVLVGCLRKFGHEKRLSPHLYIPGGEKVEQLFMATKEWIRNWLWAQGLSWRAVTGSTAAEPANHAELFRLSLELIAGKALLWGVPRARLFQYDQTYIPTHPTTECAPHACTCVACPLSMLSISS